MASMSIRYDALGRCESSLDVGKTWHLCISAYDSYTTLTNATGDLWVTPSGWIDWSESSGEQKKKETKMRGLFEVFFVDKDDGVLYTTMVAKDEVNARIKAWQDVIAEGTASGDIDDYCCLTQRIGDVPAKKETKEVKIVKDE